MKKKVVVFGSFVVDLAGRADELPVPGQTVLGNSFKMGPGGKGSNQAVAAHRAGADVVLITKVGKDTLSNIALDFYKNEKMTSEYVFCDKEVPTGVALISVNEKTAQNSIMVVPGACNNITEQDIEICRSQIENADYLVLQHEINMDAQERIIDLAYNAGVKVILNPAPAIPISKKLLAKVDTIIPNETEAYVLTGVEVNNMKDLDEVAHKFLDCGTRNVVITLGARGVYANDGSKSQLLDCLKVNAIDTTGAGDAFVGGFIAALAEGYSLFDAVKYGNATGALAVTQIGTAPAMPFKEEINKMAAVYYPELKKRD